MATINEKMTAIADEIRVLSGATDTMGLDAMASNVADANNEVDSQANLISQIAAALEGKTGGSSDSDPVLQSKTVTPATSTQTVKPDSGYDGLSQVTVNAMPTATQATPSISVSTGGLITASATQTAGYVTAGTKSATKQLTVQAAQTITPGTTDKTIASGRYLTGTQTIKGDANLVAGNIKSGVSIFGVSGSYEGSGGGTGGGGSTAQTCTVTINLPKNVAIFGWGERDVYMNGSYGMTDTLPDTGAMKHKFPADSTQVFKNMPIGTTFTFYYESSTITGVTCSDTIEFGYANIAATPASTFHFAVCRVNGDGEITITV